jgi:uncharacterized membrane protein
MAQVNEAVEVDVPVSTAYNQWTQFEDFPKFMENVESVRQIDDTHLHWVAEIGGRRVEWDAKITQQEPDSRIAWQATDGKENGGEVRFESLGPNRTRVDVELNWEPDGMVESLGEKLGSDSRGVKADVERFKELVEQQGESGAWRGEVREGEVVRPDAS